MRERVTPCNSLQHYISLQFCIELIYILKILLLNYMILLFLIFTLNLVSIRFYSLFNPQTHCFASHFIFIFIFFLKKRNVNIL